MTSTDSNLFTKKAIEIINTQGVGEWLKQRETFNFEALRNGYCIDIEGCCEEDRCDCAKYRGMSNEQILEKLSCKHNDNLKE